MANYKPVSHFDAYRRFGSVCLTIRHGIKQMNMKYKAYYKIILAVTLLDIVLLTACIPVCHTVYPLKVKNCTSDTLIIGGTCYYNVSSMNYKCL